MFRTDQGKLNEALEIYYDVEKKAFNIIWSKP